MKNLIYNLGYFFKEVRIILKLNMLSNLLSVLSTGLIFFILAMVLSGWWVSSQVVEAIQNEAEISVYYDETFDGDYVMQLVDRIESINGVKEAKMVSRDEAYTRMETILGKDARVLEYFDTNPFNPFIEVKIDIERMDSVLERIDDIVGITHVRDNRDILERLKDLSQLLNIVGYLVVAAVGISTLVIIAHIIRMGIYENKEQINTLRLMGAPESFIGFPFLLEGLVITVCGGLIASALAAFALKYLYVQLSGPLPFIPLPPQRTLVSGIISILIALSTILGITGSLFGLKSARR